MSKITKVGSKDSARRPSAKKSPNAIAKPATNPAEDVVCEAESKPTAMATSAPSAVSKQATVLEMLRCPQGVSIEDIVAATNWQKHSVRGFLSGTVKKRLSLALMCEGVGRERTYRVPAETTAAQSEAGHAGE